MQSVQRLSRGEPVNAGPQPQVKLVRSAAAAAFTIQIGDRTMDATITLPSAQAGGGFSGVGLGRPSAPPQ
jgi:hypothetical protein